MIEKKEIVFYYHQCKKLGCQVLKVNKEPCQFCGTTKWYKKIEIIKKHVFPLVEKEDEKAK